MGKIAQHRTLEDLISEFVPPGGVIGVGGLHFHNTPMAMVRELIRQQVAIRLLIPPLDGSINADMLIGAGLVEEVRLAYLGMEIFGLARRFRAAAESGSLKVRDNEEAGFALAIIAGAAGQPFAMLPPGMLPAPGPIPTVRGVNPVDYRAVIDPFTGAEQIAVQAISPDVSLIHAQLIDRRGNCGFLGATFLDAEIARAGKICLVQAEQEVEDLPAECRGYLPGYVVDAYCVVEGGAHPASSHGLYGYDPEHLELYVAASASDAGFARYCREVIGPSEAFYRKAASVLARIAKLALGYP